MAEADPSRPQSTKKITDVDVDSLAHCAGYLNLQDLSNLAISCKYFKRVAYSDSIWLRWFRDTWPEQTLSCSSQTLEVREAYMARRTALQQFKFVDPFVADFYTVSQPYSHIAMDKNDVVFSQSIAGKGTWRGWQNEYLSNSLTSMLTLALDTAK